MADTETSKGLQYDGEQKVNSKGEAILGRLYGPVADIVNATRNGRKYPDELWEKVLDDPLVKEQFECGGLFGELNHPTDREETDLTQVCVCMPERPQKKNGKLWAYLDILNTPNGKILKTICDYGYKIGISSRGSGDTYVDSHGDTVVDPDTYQLMGWDIVLIPAVKSARLKYVAESLGTHIDSKFDVSDGLRMALTEALNSANAEDRAVMEHTLNTLHLDYNIAKNDVYNNRLVENLVADEEADNDGDHIVKDLKRVMRENRELGKQLKDLQEQLSVCHTKETKSNESLNDMTTRVVELENQLSEKNAKISALVEQISIRNTLINKFNEAQEKSRKTAETLNESVAKKSTTIQELQSKVKSLTESLETEKSSAEAAIESLKENLQELSKDSAIKQAEYEGKLSKQGKLIERFKAIAQTAIDKYISSKSTMLGVTSSDIKSKLPENYSFNDIDRVCESLKNFKLSTNALPFDTTNAPKSVKMKVSESVMPTRSSSSANNGVDDNVDDSLIGLARIKQ